MKLSLLLFHLFCFSLRGQDTSLDFHAQATTIAQTHGPFHAPYSGKNSLRPIRETDDSLTGTLFFTLKYRGTEFTFDPEVAGGTGFSGVTGIAGFPNGEIPRVAKPTPTPYIARLYLKQTVPHFSWTFGKFAASDFFDANAFSHDPRTQFQNWALMYNGAWDYAADTRGYTVGVMQEFTWRSLVFRAASLLEPTQANAMQLDRHIASNHSENFEFQHPYPHGGIVRLLAFINHANMGIYRQADRDIVVTRRPGTLKYGFGLNLEQRITEEIGAFVRLGWNDGKTESWAFTEIDRTAAGGISIHGKRWKRKDDVAAAGFAVNGISGDHRAYLARGGYGFLIGDGRLEHYGREMIFESYYAWHVWRYFTLTPDFQFIANPAYNRDRGPVPIAIIRFHFEI